MFGSEILDVAIGLIFIYLLLSLICSAINELIEAWLKNRATNLKRGIEEMLNDPNGTDWAKKIYDHPLIKGLSKKADLPSYIPARNFALALMDVVSPADKSAAAISGAARATQTTLAAAPQNAPGNPVQNLRQSVGLIENTEVKQALLTLVDAAGEDAVKARENIEAWFNSVMDRTAGWYKRRVQLIILIIGLLVSGATNADTIAIANSLSHDAAARNSLVAVAQEYAKKQPSDNTDAPEQRVRKNLEVINKLGLPIGWDRQDPRTIPPVDHYLDWLLKLLGWLLTAVAISLGAPFWFDLLNKFIVVRSTVKPREKSPEERSKD
jgi:hypothetical protein